MEKKKTNFGKEIKKLMIDNDENLINLALILNVTVPFVSSVLNGNRNVPDTWFNILKEHYNLDDKQLDNLKILAEESKDTIKVDLTKCNDNQRGLAVQLQRNLSNLSEEEIEKIKNILERGDNGF